MIKVPERLGTEETYSTIIKTIYEINTASIILNGAVLEATPLKSVMCQGCPLYPCLFNVILETLPGTIKNNIKLKGNKGQENIKFYLFSDKLINMRAKISTRNLLEMINGFTNVVEYKIKVQNSVPSHIPITSRLRESSRKQSHS